MQKTETRMQKTEYRIQKECFVGREKPATPRDFGNFKPEANAFGLNTAPFCILSPEFCIPSQITVSPEFCIPKNKRQ